MERLDANIGQGGVDSTTEQAVAEWAGREIARGRGEAAMAGGVKSAVVPTRAVLEGVRARGAARRGRFEVVGWSVGVILVVLLVGWLAHEPVLEVIADVLLPDGRIQRGQSGVYEVE